MTMKSAALLAAALLLTVGCGSDNPAGPGSGGGAGFSARIDGAAWSSSTQATGATGSPGGIFTIVGGTLTAGAPALSLTLYNIAAAGTYPLGVGPSVPGGTALVSEGSIAWSTPLSGAAGTVTVTELSATRIVGTFSFVAEPFLGAPSNNRTVTEGSFDLALTVNGSITVPPHAGSRFGGSLGGAPWNAATIVMVSAPSSGTLAVGISNNAYNITLILSGWAGETAYVLNSGVSRQVSVTTLAQPTRVWGGNGGLSSGTITVSSATATRIAGSYDILLQPSPINPTAGTLALTGTFDIGIPQ